MFTLVWLEPQFAENTEYENIGKQLRSIIYDLHIFQEDDECEQYIRNKNEEHIVVFANVPLRNESFLQVHQLPQVSVIYFYGEVNGTIPQVKKASSRLFYEIIMKDSP